jgi:hypothetical protein
MNYPIIYYTQIRYKNDWRILSSCYWIIYNITCKLWSDNNTFDGCNTTFIFIFYTVSTSDISKLLLDLFITNQHRYNIKLYKQANYIYHFNRTIFENRWLWYRCNRLQSIALTLCVLWYFFPPWGNGQSTLYRWLTGPPVVVLFVLIFLYQYIILQKYK